MVKKNSPESLMLPGSNVTPVLKMSQVKAKSGEMNKKFSELESAGALTGGELLAVSQESSNDSLQSKKITVDSLKWFISPGFTGTITYSSGFDSSEKFDGGTCWKSEVLLDDASVVSPVNISIPQAPCNSDGIPLMYTLNVYLDGESADRGVYVLLTVFGEITQFRDVKTNEMKPGTAPTYAITYWK